MSVRVLQPRRPWEGRRVVLGITGGIAAYKSVQIARDLTRECVETVLADARVELERRLSGELEDELRSLVDRALRDHLSTRD